MILMQAKNLAKSFGTNIIFSNVSFTVAKGDKIGLVGPNGAGKTTLLRCLTGSETEDAGQITVGEKVRLGYLEQISEFKPGQTLFDSVMEVFADLIELRDSLRRLEAAMADAGTEDLEKLMADYARVTEEYERSGGFACESTVRKVTTGLSFKEEDLRREISGFSGGEKTRASLARLLCREPDILLLDEPTNHLDIQAVEWLEDYLRGYKGTVLLISHDRYFLDRVTEKIFELDFGVLQEFPGNYSKYLRLKEEQETALTKAYAKQQQEIKATEEYINRFRAGIKSKQARGRQSQLDRLERIAAPQRGGNISLHAVAAQVGGSGNLVLETSGLRIGFGARVLLDNGGWQVWQGQKVALIGSNGTGKSSLLKVIAGEMEPLEGQVRLGSRVKLGYYDQEHAGLNVERRVLDEIQFEFGLKDQEARDCLAALLFRGDDVYKSIGDLSGGERGRLAFLKLLLSGANFLVLDEPTNHLDIASKQIIEDFLVDFPGTVLVVSHDRYFLDKVTDRTLELGDGRLKDYPGNYSYYRDHKLVSAVAEKSREKAIKPEVEAKPKLNKAKTRDKIKGLEQEIEVMEQRLQVLSELLAEPETYQAEEQAKELVAEYNYLEQKVPATYREWEELCELLENC